MKRAIISDIHSNLEALEAVLADIDQQGITEIYCLGDVIGYGPNPRECIDRVMQCNVCILGNHDQGALFDPEGFNAGAERAIFWTREQLEAPAASLADRDAALELPGRVAAQSPRERLSVRPRFGPQPAERICLSRRHLQPAEDGKNLFADRKLCFQGHTHVPGVFTQNLKFLSPDEVNYQYRLAEMKAMVNVGSVGPAARRQPAGLLRGAWKTTW